MNDELVYMFEYMASEYMGYNPILSESQVVTMLGEDSGVATVIVKVNELGKQAYNVIFSVAIVSAEKDKIIMNTKQTDELVDLICDLYDEYTDKAIKENNEKMWYHHVGVVFACETILNKVQDLEYDNIGC